MSDNTLYMKINDNEYVKWGMLGKDYMSLPYGLWLITHHEGSSGCTNLSMLLADEAEIINTKVLLDRINLKEKILSTMLQVSQGSYSLDDMASAIAVDLAPSNISLNLRK